MTSTLDALALPGRLSTPGQDLKNDPRSDPRMVAALAAFALDVIAPPPPVGMHSPIEELLEFGAATEAGFAMVFDAFFANLAPIAGVVRSTEVITGVDGNEINLYIHRPADVEGPLPCVVHTHGGGMVIAAAADSNYVRWRDELASRAMVVVGVEFRNGAGKLGPHPFPAGLNDCASAVQWTHQNRAKLGISKIVVSGESGGGNLCIATALKARQDGWLDQIDGIYAMCPYISGLYAEQPAELPSMHENDGYLLGCSMMGAMVKLYDPMLQHRTNPLAWPYHAGADDLVGLPPHVISVNELDPLRDEGLAYYRKLVRSGVSAVSRTVNGTCHAGDGLLIEAMPDVAAATLRDIKGFADSL